MDSIIRSEREEIFTLKQAENYSGLSFPVAGDQGIKSAISPNFGGDSKVDQNTFLLEPVSIENLHNNRSTRNFWCHIKDQGVWSATGVSAEEESKKFTSEQEESELTAGYMWQTVRRTSKKYQLESKITSFVPMDQQQVEIFQVEIKNISGKAQEITPTAAIPIYGRSADNIRDHRHVTSLLHRITVSDYGVQVKPTLSFDERGHQKNEMTYFVLGVTGDGEKPADFYPVVEDFLGEGGSFTHPRAILINQAGVPSGTKREGKEALGGIHFPTVTLEPQQKKTYTILLGVTKETLDPETLISLFDSEMKVRANFEKTKREWASKVNLAFHTGDPKFDHYMRWVSFQPILRRIYGCSFLPYHDYGKGGRGWRDLWQDCLALLLMNPEGVREMLLNNFGGIRMDGTNATIIGEKPGEFVADRNHITRVWMDHGFWPFLTTKLYMDQTGDLEILGEQLTYFKDAQVERGTGFDEEWNESLGSKQKTANGEVYYGTVLEHLLLEQLGAFYEVGDHNEIRLRGADWNDALDMAEKSGESVAFTSAYAGNLNQLADYLEKYAKKTGTKEIFLAKEMSIFFEDDNRGSQEITKKQQLLAEYGKLCRHTVSGEKAVYSIETIAKSLREKADWIHNHIRSTEWVSDSDENGWFNGYYDNNGRQVEGQFDSGIRMMLTSQVFPIMSGTATVDQIKKICQSADRYLYRKEVGGYRLNTNFHEEKYDMGRMFGFAYGEKENGAVFSHMTVMYANALYQRGFVREGYVALQTLADTAMDFKTSKSYPGVPEYFNADGRGMYPYLTGAASWYLLTMVTQVYGVRGEQGNLSVEPKLVKEQFDEAGEASVSLLFDQKEFEVCYRNPQNLDYGEYQIQKVLLDGEEREVQKNYQVTVAKEEVNSLSSKKHRIEIVLGR